MADGRVGGSIFESDSVSRELLDKWDAWDKAIADFNASATLEEKRQIVAEHPEIVGEVTCEACNQILDSGERL